MRSLAILMPALMFLTSACGGGGAAEVSVPQDEAKPAPIPAAPTAGNAAEPASNAAAAPDAPDAPNLAGLSPYQRRAYDLGLRDCSAGRYEPDPHPEAYRIGCAAVQDR